MRSQHTRSSPSPLISSVVMAQCSNSSLSVAVIGLGAQGLVAVIDMVEEGFSVVEFEKADSVGGI